MPDKTLRQATIFSWRSLLDLLLAVRHTRVILFLEFDARPSMAATGFPGADPSSAIERLKRAANLKPIKKRIVLNNGDELELYHKPLTMAQRERAQKNTKGEEQGAFILQLLIEVALDENGQRMFNAGHIMDLKNFVRDEDLQKLMLAILSNEPDEDPSEEGGEAKVVDMKRNTAAASAG